ncbi:MAG: sigma-70 family RNA polymerase sigma factor [Candidatus Edwardsbacteria bacterium]
MAEKPAESLDETGLVVQAKGGDLRAFDSLVEKYQKRIYALAYRMTKNHDDADDIAQETFTRAYYALARFKVGESFFSWLYRIAINQSLNQLRRKRRLLSFTSRHKHGGFAREETSNGQSSLEEELVSPQPSPLDCLEAKEMKRKLEEAIDYLPAEQKAVFLLRVQEERSYEEIARILHIPKGTVMSRLNRARGKLREELKEYL